MRPDDRRLGRQGRIKGEGQVGLGDVEASLAAIRLPASLEIERERRHIAEVLDGLLRLGQAERAGIEPERLDRGRR